MAIPQIPLRSKLQGPDGLMSTSWGFYFSALQDAVEPIISGPVVSFNARTGNVVLLVGDVTGALGFVPSPINSPAFTGVPTAATAALNTNNNQLATTQFVMNQIGTSTGINQQQVLRLVSLRI